MIRKWKLTEHELLVLGALAHVVEVSDAGDFGFVTFAGHRRENANVFAYAARPHVIVVRSLARTSTNNHTYVCNTKLSSISIKSATYSAVDTVKFVSRQGNNTRQVSDSYASTIEELLLLFCCSAVVQELVVIFWSEYVFSVRTLAEDDGAAANLLCYNFKNLLRQTTQKCNIWFFIDSERKWQQALTIANLWL